MHNTKGGANDYLVRKISGSITVLSVVEIVAVDLLNVTSEL